MTCRAGGRIGDLERRIAVAEENVRQMQELLRRAHDAKPDYSAPDTGFWDALIGAKAESIVTSLPAFSSQQAPLDYVARKSPRTAD